MAADTSDAFVFFGATGDLAFKQIFPALLGLIRDEGFDLPIIGIARSGDLDSLRERARQSLAAAGIVDQAAIDSLVGRLRYVKGSDDDIETFHALRRELGAARHPLHYLAVPPALFGEVVTNLAASRMRGRRPGHPREAVRARPRERGRPQRDRPRGLRRSRRSSGSTTTWARSRSRTCSTSGSPTRSWSRSGIAITWRASRSRWRSCSTSPGAARSTTGRARFVT